MARRLFLHIGMPKCATTTVQDFLGANRAGLAEHGIFYDYHRSYRESDQGNGVQLARDLMWGNPAPVAEFFDFFLRRDGDVVLSSENFFGLARSPAIGGVLDNIRARGFEVVVICYLRRQDLWIESDYKQQVKGGSDWIGSLPDLLKERSAARVLNYNWMLGNWARYAGQDQVIAVPLRPGQAPEHPVRAFLDVIGAADLLAPEATLPRLRNVSPPTGLIEPARYLKAAMLGHGMSTVQATREVERFFELAPRIGPVPPRRFLLSHHARLRLLQRFQISNERLAERFLGGEGFAPSLEKDAASERQLSDEAAALLARYWLHYRPALRTRSRLRRGLHRLLRKRSAPQAGQG